MFNKSQFNNDIGQWDVSSVQDISDMFYDGKFNGDISNWNAINVQYVEDIFYNCSAPVPYWAKIENHEERKNTIESYQQKKQLERVLEKKLNKSSIIKV